jgi:hypothetical protein
MKVAIFAGGHINSGTYSSVSGEGRWALGLVDSFVKHVPGIEIDLYNDSVPSWGHQTPLPGVTMKSYHQISSDVRYSAALYIPWELKLPTQLHHNKWVMCDQLTQHLKADLYAHCQFSWTTGLLSYPCSQEGHIIVYPFRESARTFDSAKGVCKFPAEFLPYPHCSEYKLADPTRTEVVLPSKEVYHKDFGPGGRSTHIPLAGNATLRALIRLFKENPKLTNANFFAAHGLEPSWSPVINQLGVRDLIDQLPHTLHNWLTYDKVQAVLSRCKVSLPVGGLAASLTESVAMGALPLVFGGTALTETAERLGCLMNHSDPNPEQAIYELVSEYLNNDRLYIDTINAYQDAMAEHKQDNVARRFLEIYEKYRSK